MRSTCWARGTCSTCPRAELSPARTRRLRGRSGGARAWWSYLKQRASRTTSTPSCRRPGRPSRASIRSPAATLEDQDPLFDEAVQIVYRDPPRLHLRCAAPAQDRLQPGGPHDRGDGAHRCRGARGDQRKSGGLGAASAGGLIAYGSIAKEARRAGRFFLLGRSAPVSIVGWLAPAGQVQKSLRPLRLCGSILRLSSYQDETNAAD